MSEGLNLSADRRTLSQKLQGALKPYVDVRHIRRRHLQTQLAPYTVIRFRKGGRWFTVEMPGHLTMAAAEIIVKRAVA